MRAVDQLRAVLDGPRPVHAPGVQDALTARLAADAGARVLYLSGAVTSATVLGRPDLGYVSGHDIAELGRRVLAGAALPLVADADTGYGNAVHVGATVERYVAAGIAGLHLEDQVSPKRCGHLAGKQVVPLAEARQKVAAAVEAAAGRIVVIARTDAWSVEGPDAAVERAAAYAAAGADLVFVEGLRDEDDLARVGAGLGDEVGLVLNRSEAQGDVAPLPDEVLARHGVALVIHPVSAMLAAAHAAAATYRQVVEAGRVEQPRMAWPELNDVLGLPAVLAAEARHAAAELEATSTPPGADGPLRAGSAATGTTPGGTA